MSAEFLSLETLQELARNYGYWAVFWGIALENTGIPLPGETITIIGGFLAGSGELQYGWVLATAISGAVLGDNFGYWIGRTGGWPFLQRVGRLFRISEERLDGVRERFSDNAPRAVFFGRFVMLLRIFAGPLAGVAKMPYPQFLICNLGGATLWAMVMVSLSFFLGRVIPLAQIIRWVTQFGILALFALVASILIPIWWESRRDRLPKPTGEAEKAGKVPTNY